MATYKKQQTPLESEWLIPARPQAKQEAKAKEGEAITPNSPEIETSKLQAVRYFGLPKPFDSAFLARLDEETQKTFTFFAKPVERFTRKGASVSVYDCQKLPDGVYLLKSEGRRSKWRIENGVARLIERL